MNHLDIWKNRRYRCPKTKYI